MSTWFWTGVGLTVLGMGALTLQITLLARGHIRTHREELAEARARGTLVTDEITGETYAGWLPSELRSIIVAGDEHVTGEIPRSSCELCGHRHCAGCENPAQVTVLQHPRGFKPAHSLDRVPRAWRAAAHLWADPVQRAQLLSRRRRRALNTPTQALPVISSRTFARRS